MTGVVIGRIEETIVGVTLQKTKDTVVIEIVSREITVLCVIGVALVIGNAEVNRTWVAEFEIRSS